MNNFIILNQKQKDYYLKNLDRKNNSQKIYNNENRAKKMLCEQMRRETKFDCQLAHNISIRTCQAFKSQNVEKLNKTFDLIGGSLYFSKTGFFPNFKVI